MYESQYVLDAGGKRQFACFPASVLAFIIDNDERILLLSHPDRGGMWEVVNGSVEADEYILDAALREVREEVGTDIDVRPLGTFHAFTHHYDENVRYMISLCYVLAYEGGHVIPGDDMAGSDYRWWTLEELHRDSVGLIVPWGQKWLATRAVQLHGLWKDESVNLEPERGITRPSKYALRDDTGAFPPVSETPQREK